LEIDLSQLMGGETFTVPCSLVYNGTFVDNIHALPDSGANGYAFLDTQFAKDVMEFLGCKAKPLDHPIIAKGYDGVRSRPITHYVLIDLVIDGRRLVEVPFLILQLGNQDMILGAKWMAHFDVQPDLRRQRLIWPANLPQTSQRSFAKQLRVTRDSFKPQPIQPEHQWDVIRRQHLFDKKDSRDVGGKGSGRISQILLAPPMPTVEDVPTTPPACDNASDSAEFFPEPGSGSLLACIDVPLGTPGVPVTEASDDIEVFPEPGSGSLLAQDVPITCSGATYARRLAQDIRAMEANFRLAEIEGLRDDQWYEQDRLTKLAEQLRYERRRQSRDPDFIPEPKEAVDIFEISAAAFHLNIRRPDNELFSTSVFEIDRELQARVLRDTDEDWAEILAKLPANYRPYMEDFSKAASDTLPPRREYDHKITLEADHTLGHGPLYSQSTEELVILKKYLLENLDKGFIEPSQAPYSSPVLFVKKPNGGLRFCIDFRKLNAITRKDRYPLPLIDETLARLSKAKIFTKLDIRQAFHRIRIAAESEDLTTFRTRYGSYKCKVLPFGLTNGPATYQRYMNDILFEYLDVFCTVYLDDILIYSENELEHEEHVIKVLQKLREAGLQADIKKCEFGVKRTKYLGFIVTTDGIEVDPDKVSVIHDWKAPRTVKGVQSFLGFCNFYRRFIRDYGTIAKPLVRLTRKDTDFYFADDCHGAFEELKRRLTHAPVLAHYHPERETMLETDASDGVLAGVLSQEDENGEWHPVSFFSKTMAPAELNYEVHDKEMLAIVRSLSHWRAELQGSPRRLRILTDHRSLEYFMTTKQLTSRQARWSELLSQFFFQIMYRPGKSNELADALSRREQDVSPQDGLKKEIRFKPLLSSDQIDPQIKSEVDIFAMDSLTLIDAILQANKQHSSLDDLRAAARAGQDQTLKLEEGLLFFKNLLLVPDVDDLRTQLIRESHAPLPSAHPSPGKTIKMLRERYFWRSMRRDVTQYILNCTECRSAHRPRDKTPGLLRPLPIPQYRWQHICVDFKSFPPDKQGYDNVAVFIDRLSKEAVSIPCTKEATAKDLAEMFYIHVYRHHNTPESIVSDRGPQFISAFWNAFCGLIGTKVKLSTAYHPETDGQTEIMNQYLDQRLRPYVNHYQDNWASMLPAMDNAQLTLPHETIGMSPYELSHGVIPRKSFDWKEPDSPTNAREELSQQEARQFVKSLQRAYEFVRANMEKAQQANQRQANKKRREPDFEVHDRVWLLTDNLKTDRPSRKLDHQQVGPYEIVAKKGHSYQLDLPASMGIHKVFHASLLRKAANNPLPGQKVTPLPPVNITGEDEWELLRIRAVRQRWKSLQYRADWLGHDEDPQYYPASNFKYSPHLLKEFHLANPELPGPPARLLDWIKAYNEGIDDYDYLDDNSAMDARSRASFFGRGG
jgi:hypothetical protein